MSMMEWIHSLNEYAGLFSLLAVIVAIVVPIAIYRRGRRNEMQEAQNELDSINETSRFAMPTDIRNYFTRKSILEKKLRK